jgi:hypothetical protein
LINGGEEMENVLKQQSLTEVAMQVKRQPLFNKL